jgi:hypothetical protein
MFIAILSMALGTLAPNAEMTIYRLPEHGSGQTISI